MIFYLSTLLVQGKDLLLYFALFTCYMSLRSRRMSVPDDYVVDLKCQWVPRLFPTIVCGRPVTAFAPSINKLLCEQHSTLPAACFACSCIMHAISTRACSSLHHARPPEAIFLRDARQNRQPTETAAEPQRRERVERSRSRDR